MLKLVEAHSSLRGSICTSNVAYIPRDNRSVGKYHRILRNNPIINISMHTYNESLRTLRDKITTTIRQTRNSHT